MNQADKLRLLKAEFPKSDEDALLGVLSTSDAIVYARVYGYLNEAVPRPLNDLEDRVSIEVAKRILWKRGADGESSHSENGVSANWGANQSGFDDVFRSWGLRPRVGGVIITPSSASADDTGDDEQ